ncbi:MAG: hypothetical protein AAB479_02025 [Patescibacteria group bacterium]
MKSIYRKIVAAILCVSFIGGTINLSPVAKATDGGGAWAQASAYMTKEYGLDTISRAAAAGLYQFAVNKLLEKIQGRGGEQSGIIKDWRNFQTNAQYRGEDVFRSILANTRVCDYLRKDIDTAFRVSSRFKIPLQGHNIRVNDLDPYTLRARCSMATNFDPQKFQQDFAGNGGWQAYTQLLQPENNFYGLLLQSLGELEQQRALEEGADLRDAQTGYRSFRPPECEQPLNATSRCIFLGKVATPGDLVAKAAGLILDKNLEWLTNADEISEIVVAIANYAYDYFSNLSEADDFTAEDTIGSESADQLEYCTAKRPSERVQKKYSSKFPGYTKKGSLVKKINLVGLTLTLAEILGLRNGGKDGPCEALRNKDNPYPFQTCSQNCLKDVGYIPVDINLPPLQDEYILNDTESTSSPAPRPSGSPGPSGPPPSTCAPDAGGCVVNEIGNTCVNASYREAVVAAITQYIQSNPDVFEDPGADAPTIKDGRTQEYMAGVVAILNQQGYSAQVDSEDEIVVKRSGGSFSESYDILTSGRQVRRFHAATCTPASF